MDRNMTEKTVQSAPEGKLLEVKDLRVSFFTPAGEVKAVDVLWISKWEEGKPYEDKSMDEWF